MKILKRRLKFMRKKVCVFISVVIALAMLLTGCNISDKGSAGSNNKGNTTTAGSETAAGNTSQSDSNLNAPGTLPVVKNKVTLSIMLPQVGTALGDVKENLQTKEIEEKTNIHIEWQEVPTDYLNQVSIIFASGDMPDMVFSGAGGDVRMSKTLISQLGAQGLIIPLNDLIENHAFHFKKVMEELPELRKFMTNPDGNIYSLPSIDDGPHIQFQQKMWINTTWLKNLGLDMPKTTDEFYQVLVAFRDNDPNQNGKKDEIPLSTVKSGSAVELDGFLMNPFILTPSGVNGYGKTWIDDQGKIVYSPIQPGYKEGLKYLHKLYAEGLIYKESFTQDMKTQQNLNESGDAPVIGAFPAMRPGYANNLTASNRWHQYDSLLPLEGPSGQRITDNNLYLKYNPNFVVITSNCKYPEVAMQFIDYFYSEEGTVRSVLGREGIDYKYAEAGQKGFDGSQAKYVQIPVDTTLPENQNVSWGQAFPTYRPVSFYKSIVYPENPYDPNVDPMVGRMTLFFRTSMALSEYAQKPESVLPDMFFSADDISTMSRLKTSIESFVNESIVKFITGYSDIDAEWDNYLKQLKSLGIDEYLGILQNAYDAQFK